MERQDFLRAVETSDCQVFVEWYLKAQNQNNSAVKESVDRLTTKELSGVWTVFNKWVMDITNAISKNTPALGPAEKDEILCSLGIMSALASYTIQALSNNEPVALSPCVGAMNKSLKYVTCKKTGTAICEMCEAYWKIHPELETSYSTHVIHWYLNQAIQPKATAASVKQVWHLKGSLEKMDPLVLESSGLLDLIFSALKNPKFLNSSEGRKIVACLFNFDPSLVQRLHKSLKNLIPLASISDCEAIGEIYFKAWRTISENCRAEVEFSIQDLMYHAVVAQRKPLGAVEGGFNKTPMSKLIFHVLHSIHRQRKQRTVAILIYNLYKPILWRYLEATNGLVRANALCLFFDAFPFECGEDIEEEEALRKKQWDIMSSALVDEVPLNRTIAIQGTCRILNEYWELIPVNIIQEFITVILRKLIYDSSSPDVRAQVVKGLAVMLDNSQTHQLLEKMIPLTNKVLHDPHDKVRAEYVSLLTKIQKQRVSKLWEVIDVNHLIVRLAVDTSKSVIQRLVVLLAPYYHPKDSTPDVIFKRCLSLVIDNRVASRKFYQHVHSCVGIQQLAQLVLIIWKFLRNYVHSQLEKTRTGQQRAEPVQNRQRSRASKRTRRSEPTNEASCSTTPDDDKENQDLSSDDEGESEPEGLDETSIIGLIDVVCIIFSVNKGKFKASPNNILWGNIKARYNKTCSIFFRYFKQSEGLRSLIYLYGLISSNSSPHMLSFVKSQLKSLNDDAMPNEFGFLIDVMCNWGRGEDLLESISDHLQDSLNTLTTNQMAETLRRSRRGTEKKRVSFDRLSHEKPLLGLRYLAYILQHPYNKKIILRQNLLQMEQLCESLAAVTETIEASPEKLTSKDSFLFVASCLYVKIVLVLTCFYKREESKQTKYDESQEQIMEILKWTNRMLITEGINPLVGDLASSVISSISNLILIHFTTSRVCRQFLDVVLELCMRFPSSGNLKLAMNCAYLSLAFIWSERSIGNECDIECDIRVGLVIKYVFECPNLVSGDQKLCIDENDWPVLRDIIRKILEECHDNGLEKNENLRSITRSMIDTIRQDMMLIQTSEADETEKIPILSQLSKAIIASFRTRNTLTQMMLNEFFENLKTEKETTLLNLNVLTRLLKELSSDKPSTTSGTLKNAFTSLVDIWSLVADVEKKANLEIASYIDTTIKELKKVF